MGRPRIMLDVRIFHNAKFGALSNRGKLGWIYLLCEAKQQDREGLFPSRPGLLLGAGPYRDRVSEWLEVGLLHYGEAACPRCLKVYGDVPPTAAVVHDWHDYQPSRTTLWREERGVGKGGLRETMMNPPRNDGETPSETFGETEVKPLRARVTRSVSVSSSRSEKTEGVQGEDPADAYWSLTGRYPTDRPLAWIDDLTSKYGADATVRALARAHIADPKTATLLGRAQDLLRAEARSLDRQEQEAEKARLREKRAIPKVIPAWEQEFRAALEAKYGAA